MEQTKEMAILGSGNHTTSLTYTLLLGLYGLLLVLFAAVFFISEWQQVPLQDFTGDPAYIFNGHPFVGFISNIGILLWCATASICLFAFFVINRSQNAMRGAFLLFSGLLTLLLLFDDLFMLHDFMVPNYTPAPEEAFYGLYGIIMIAGGIYFWDEVAGSEYILLGIALLFLGASVVGDLVLPVNALGYLLEDAFKLFGIVTWFIYFAQLALVRIFSALEPSQS